jgi:4-hydroxy-3-methylbut-2-en-1-yl diphosphate synthase IspG/GcpE
MASHLLLYRRVSDQNPVACIANANEVLNDTGLIPVRMLTGTCPLCGRCVSKLSGASDPMPSGYDTGFRS